MFTRQTTAPIQGKGLSVSVGSPALANVEGRISRKLFTAELPRDLLDELRRVGLAEFPRTAQAKVIDQEIRFTREAMEILNEFFKEAL